MKYYLKKAILFVLIAVLSLIIIGCGKKETPDNSGKKCTIMVECSKIFDNQDKLDKAVKDYIPKDGIILKKKEVSFNEGENVYDVLKRELKNENILMEASFTTGTAYIEGINNIYEFSCGELSGWMYCVNGEYPNVGCSNYKVQPGDSIEWHYTCDLGEDLKN